MICYRLLTIIYKDLNIFWGHDVGEEVESDLVLARDHKKWPLSRMMGTRDRGASLCGLRSTGEHTVNHGLVGACAAA